MFGITTSSSALHPPLTPLSFLDWPDDPGPSKESNETIEPSFLEDDGGEDIFIVEDDRRGG